MIRILFAPLFLAALVIVPASAQDAHLGQSAGYPLAPIAELTVLGTAALPPETVAPPVRPIDLGRDAMEFDNVPLALTDEDRALLRRISDHHSAIETQIGRFVQVDSGGGRTEGSYYIERPNKVRFRYAPPSREEIISTGRGFYVVDKRARTSYAYPQDRVPLRQFLTDRIDLLSTNVTGLARNQDSIAVTLADDTPIGLVRVTLIFEADTLELSEWQLVEPGGATTSFAVYDSTTGVEIPPGYFYIDPTFTSPRR